MRQLTADTEHIRAEIEQAEAVGNSPDGTVHVTMRSGQVASVAVDPAAMDHDNVYLAGQVMAAIRQAQEQSAEFLKSRTSPMFDAVEQLRNQMR
jgi:DNA-binding protein YbaB